MYGIGVAVCHFQFDDIHYKKMITYRLSTDYIHGFRRDREGVG